MKRQLKSTSFVMSEMEENYKKSLGSGRQADLPLKCLKPYVDSDGTTNDYLFGPVTDETVANLAKGIREDGFQGAINVWELSNGEYMIFSGHRRAKAMQVLGREMIPCFVYNYPDTEEKRRYIFLRSNILSRGASRAADRDIYIARQMDYLRKIRLSMGFEGKSSALNEEIAKEFGTSRITVWRYLTLLSAPEKLVKMEDQGLIPLAQAAALMALDSKDMKTVLDVIDQCYSGGKPMGRAEIDSLLAGIKHVQGEFAESDEEARSAEVTRIVSTVIESKFGDGGEEEAVPAPKPKTPAARETRSDSEKMIAVFDKYLKSIQKNPPVGDERKRVIEKLHGILDLLEKQ